jgi:hypothetical protein
MIAYCGLDCSKCEGYLATQSNDNKRLAEVAKKWSEQFHADVKPEHVICDGCKAEKRKSFHCANLCKIRKCCIEKKYDSCIECGNFACSDLEFVLSSASEAKNNLEKLKR